MADLHCD